MAEHDPVAEFTAHRSRLFGLAYRMLGSALDAEDVVQDAFLRWSHTDHASVRTPGACLTKTVTNLCLNHLDSARVRREHYVGPWLPEPVYTADEPLGPLQHTEQRESVSLALLVLLEQLTPTERAAFVLREAFAYDHRSIAEILDCSEANARQLHHRASSRLRESKPRFDAGHDEWRRLAERFLAAAQEGDLPRLEQLLSEDVVSWSDGGGKARAARHPVIGRQRVARYVAGLARQAGDDVRIDVLEINAAPALLAHAHDELIAVVVPQIAGGRIRSLRSVTNPDKLRFLHQQLAGLSRSGELSGPHW